MATSEAILQRIIPDKKRLLHKGEHLFHQGNHVENVQSQSTELSCFNRNNMLKAIKSIEPSSFEDSS